MTGAMDRQAPTASVKLSPARLLRLPGSARFSRLRHALWAGAIALLLAVTHTLEPLDMVGWTFQSRLHERSPSGQIVFVEANASITDPSVSQYRSRLAAFVRTLKASGASALYVDLIFDQPSQSSADAALRSALREWGPRSHFVDRVDVAYGGTREEFRSVDAVAQDIGRVWWGITSEWPNTTFELPTDYDTVSERRRSFASSLAGIDSTSGGYAVDYSFSRASIPSYSMQDIEGLSPTRQRELLAGKKIVISTPQGATSAEFLIPTQYAAPPSYVAIYGAETLLHGGLRSIGALTATAAIALLLCLASLIARNRWRYWAYSSLVFASTYGFFASSQFDVRLSLAAGAAAIGIYAALRTRIRWQDRAANVDPDTGMPTIRAFASALATDRSCDGYVAMAKVQGYETILQTLDTAQRATYIAKLCERLRIGDARRTIYVDGPHLAWRVNEDDREKVVAHLEGLRAIFAAPVTIDAHNVDVGITFGAAPVQSGQAQRCIAAALAAVEETTEALEPIKVAQKTIESDGLWDLSLRARIDSAMEAGEVFCVYQPKMDIAADQVVGVEALVRWEDPERGFIPPLHFVMQCEKAGRMEYLTRYVLQSACSAAKLLHFRGNRITMSVNISATLLTDMRIVGIVRTVLQATEFDANYLVLEITETARIRDLTQARTVLRALKALGIHLSMDDFGVGAANFEALQALPFDEIKIDRQFVSQAASSAKSRAITASIVGLGTSARIAVVAEGAETESDLQMLRDIGCWQVQGYALAHPMTLTKLLTFLKEDASRKGWR